MSACWTRAGMPITSGDDVLTVVPATLDQASITRHLRDADAAVVMKLGDNLPKVRAALDELGLTARATYVERGSMQGEIVMPLAELPGGAKAPYFAMTSAAVFAVATAATSLASPPASASFSANQGRSTSPRLLCRSSRPCPSFTILAKPPATVIRGTGCRRRYLSMDFSRKTGKGPRGCAGWEGRGRRSDIGRKLMRRSTRWPKRPSSISASIVSWMQRRDDKRS